MLTSLLWLSLTISIASGLSSQPSVSTKLERRLFLSRSAATLAGVAQWATVSSPANAASAGNISKRLDDDILNLPAPSYASEFNGVDNTYYPSFLEGTWETTQTLIDTKTPLGLKYLGGPNGDISIAEKTMKQSQSKVGVPVKLQLRYVKTRWGVAEDRLFNNRQRLNSFAEKDVVASVAYADVGGSNRKSVVALGGSEDDPLQTTLVRFKGPAAQKNFITSHGSEKLNDESWATYELQRSIFALTNTNTAPPITTDTEYIWSFKQIDNNHVESRLRIAGYLNAKSDKLYFDARNRAVSYQEYTLDMKRIS